MRLGFWDKLEKPIFALAPMEDVTDTVFRQIVIEAGKACLPAGRPDVMFTEFTNVDAILHGEISRLKFTEEERPIVAQIWGKEPEKFYEAAKFIKKLGFDGVDINFGCPERNIIKQGACGAMIGDYKRVGEIIAATKEGAGGLPVSVKTRIGIKKIMTEEWIGFLLEQGLAAVTVHGRTVVEMSDVPCHWEEIGKAVSLLSSRAQSRDPSTPLRFGRDDKGRTLIIGNGDVKSLEQAREMVKKYGVDGVMVGRGIFENLAIFSAQYSGLSAQEKMELFKKHIELWRKTWGKHKNFAILKKFVKVYVSGFEGASEMRVKFMETKSLEEMESCLEDAIA